MIPTIDNITNSKIWWSTLTIDEKLAFLNIINTQDIQPNLLESFYLYRNLLKTTLI